MTAPHPRRPAPRDELDKASLFRELGYSDDAACDEILAAAGITNTRKPRIHASKRARVAELLEAQLFPVCNRGDCQARARSLSGKKRSVGAAGQAHCRVCAGSVNQRAVDELVATAKRAGATKVCVVGGSPRTREELLRMLNGRLELRSVDGTRAHTRAQAEENCRWADVVVVWGPTELDHRVSQLYHGPNVVTASKRGVAEVAVVARVWFERRA